MPNTSELKNLLLLWLAKEEERLVKQQTFLNKIKATGGLAAINSDAILTLEPSFEEYIEKLGLGDIL